MRRICRVCMKPSKVLVNMFTEDQSPSLVDIINECVNFNISSDDGMPKNICMSCMQSAQDAFRFKRKCEESHKLLTAQLSNEKLKLLDKLEPENALSRAGSTERNEVCESEDQPEIIEEIVLEDDNNLGCIKVEQEEFVISETEIKQQVESTESAPSLKYEELAPDHNQDYKSNKIKPSTKSATGTPKKEFDSASIDLNCVKMEEEEFISCELSKTEAENLQTDNFASRIYEESNMEREDDSFSSGSSKHESESERAPNNLEYEIYPGFSNNRAYTRKEVNKSGTLRQLVFKPKNGLSLTDNTEYLKCPYCLQRFLGQSYLNQHILSQHKLVYKCPQCPKEFSTANNLEKHKSLHFVKKLFKCPHCPKAFKQHSNLQDHLYIHFNNRPFKCPHCPRDFIEKAELSAHISTHRYTYKCPVLDCNKIFIERVELDEHVPTHSLSNGHTAWRSSASSNVYNR